MESPPTPSPHVIIDCVVSCVCFWYRDMAVLFDLCWLSDKGALCSVSEHMEPALRLFRRRTSMMVKGREMPHPHSHHISTTIC